jgi:hypothetical protein
VEQRRGTPHKSLNRPRDQLRIWLIAVPDLTLEQLLENLDETCGVEISRAQVARASFSYLFGRAVTTASLEDVWS